MKRVCYSDSGKGSDIIGDHSGRLDLKYVLVGCRGRPTMYGNSGRVELNTNFIGKKGLTILVTKYRMPISAGSEISQPLVT